MSTPQPKREDWAKAQAIGQKAGDADVLKVLRDALRELDKMIKVLDGRPTTSEAVRREQLQVVRRSLLREQAAVLKATGKIAQARRLESAARAIKLQGKIDAAIFYAAGLPASLAKELQESILLGLEGTLDQAVARLTGSPVALSQRVYRVEVWLGGRVDRMVNSALARGLTAREFAAEARQWIDPNTPGGVRYAAMRLARTEINNAFHAVSIAEAAKKPWATGMKWHLSSSHPKPDECDQLAGKVYPAEEVPSKPHPQCFCYVTPEVEELDSFLDKLIAGDYDSYLRTRVRGL